MHIKILHNVEKINLLKKVNGPEIIFALFNIIKCLFIDDLGATKPTSWKNEVMTGLLDYRINKELPTFFTSNYNIKEHQALMESSQITSRPERIPSRIYEICQGFIIEVKGEDWRKKPVLQQL